MIIRPLTIMSEKSGSSITTVLMPDGKYWTDTNLAIDDGGTGISIVDNVTANGVNFGTQYYYTWEAANRVASSISGYHLPSLSELQTLSNIDYNQAAYKLKSTTGWPSGYNGINEYGFNSYPTGPDSGWYNVGYYWTMWTSTEINSTWAYGGYINYSDEYLYNTNQQKLLYCSVRLIKDT